VKLENEFIEVYVLPEVGGKVWGAIEKATGQEFIYRNEVMKFRNIALRGPWTSGGIEFNFGVIGHTPSTATPVDYTLVENEDGSVSCFVGAMDLPSRSSWRVEIRLAPGASNFETNVYWSNPTSLVQPYYNWMTAAAFAQNDLTMSIPGDQFLTHPGEARSWPHNDNGVYLPFYANNTFEGHKSYHVVGEYNDFFGGYYADDNYGFAHWARFEDLPGQKLWLWALSREGGVWDDLLTDTDGQYVEYQAGRMLVQYAPGEADNPISKTGFPPLATDRWKERWFPVMGTGGISDVSDKGVLFVERKDGSVRVALNAFTSFQGDVEWMVNGTVSHVEGAALEPLSLWETTFQVADELFVEVRVPGLDLVYSEDAERLALDRDFDLEPDARPAQSEAEQNVFQGRQLANARYYPAARVLFEDVLAKEPWNRDALVELANLDLREGHFDAGLVLAKKALRLDAHDPDANFVAAGLYLALGATNDARDTYSWATRSMAYRSAAYARIGEIALGEQRYEEAIEFAHRSLDYDKNNISALEVVAVAKRSQGQTNAMTVNHMLSVDPLNHFARAEAFLSGASDAQDFRAGLRSEFPDQTVLELAIRYVAFGRAEDATAVLGSYLGQTSNPMIPLWMGYLNKDVTSIETASKLNGGVANPYRVESLRVLDWAQDHSEHWAWSYLKGLNLWALNRGPEALTLWKDLGNTPDNAAFYVARANLASQLDGIHPRADLDRALTSSDANRLTYLYLIDHLQSEGQWEMSLAHSTKAMQLYSGDFNLELAHAKSLLFLSRTQEAVDIMEATHVLPSEMGRESHFLFESAHLLRAIELYESGDLSSALKHTERALEWPEQLGQGRPYEPDERLATYLLFRIAEADGEDAQVNALADRVAKLNERFGGVMSPLNVLSADVSRRTGRTDTTSDVNANAPGQTDSSLTNLLVDKSVKMTFPNR